MGLRSREVRLVKRPRREPALDDFRVAEVSVPELADGEVLIQQLYMSVDPAMRPRLSDDYELGRVLFGGAIGRIAHSRHPGFAEGDLVRNLLGFREYAVSDGAGLQKLAPASDVPLTAYLSVLGIAGFTAYTGVLEVGQAKQGEQVFVSTAAGAVGSIAAQIAKIRGCYVIGSTGSDDKAAWLRDVAGLDAVLNYRTTPIAESLGVAAARGLDVYFDNVGGDHLDAALACMNRFGRIAVSGMISGYNNPETRTTVHNLWKIIYGRITVRGFVGSDFAHLRPQFEIDMLEWLRSGAIRWRETILDGVEAAPQALVGLMGGHNIGKMLVRIAPE